MLNFPIDVNILFRNMWYVHSKIKQSSLLGHVTSFSNNLLQLWQQQWLYCLGYLGTWLPWIIWHNKDWFYLPKFTKANAGKYRHCCCRKPFCQGFEEENLTLSRAILCLSFERKENSLYYIGYVEIIHANMSMVPVEIYGMGISKQNIVAYLVTSQVSVKFP